MDCLPKTDNADDDKQDNVQAKERRKIQKAKNAAWSNKTVQKAAKDKRKLKKEKKQEWLRSQRTLSTNTQSKRKELDDEDEWEELAREERMAKKLKQGKLDTKVFDEEFVGDI